MMNKARNADLLVLPLSRQQQDDIWLATGIRVGNLSLTSAACYASVEAAITRQNGCTPDAGTHPLALRLTTKQRRILLQTLDLEATELAVDANRFRLAHYVEDWMPEVSECDLGQTLRVVFGGESTGSSDSDGRASFLLDGRWSAAVFGSGLHATTQMAVDLLERTGLEGRTVLDIGTGSGVLAIASAVLGARYVVALDVSQAAVAVARRNVALNGLASSVSVELGSADSVSCQEFDVVVANLLVGVLLSLGEAIAGVLRTTGVLVVSGIVSAREQEVVEFLSSLGMDLVNAKQRDGYSAFSLRMNKS